MRILRTLLVQLLVLSCCQAALPAGTTPEAASAATGARGATGESLLHALLKVTGILAAPAQRGEQHSEAGSVWMTTVAQGAPVRWTAGSGFRSPVIVDAGRVVYAMKGDVLVRIDGPGIAPVEVSTIPGIDKLLGVQSDAADSLLALTTDARTPLLVLSLATGRRTALAADIDDPRQLGLLAQARSQSRVVGTMSIDVERQTRQGLASVLEWTDVVLRDTPDVVRNLSACDGVDCGQPAISADLARVVFIKHE